MPITYSLRSTRSKLFPVALAVLTAALLVPAKAVDAAALSSTKADGPGADSTPTTVGPTSVSKGRPDAGLLPDIVEEVPRHLSIQNAQQREYLRFSTTHWNFGDGPLQIRGGGVVAPCEIDGVPYDQCTHSTQEILNADGDVVATQPAGVAHYHPSHKHWHMEDVALFTVRQTPDGPPVGGVTLKTTFCLIDLDHSDLVAQGSDRVYWECNAELQGISVGWGDEYHQSTPGQEVDITGLPAGVYYLTHDADPADHWLETDETNNRAWVRFELTRKGANPELTILDTFGYEGNTSNK